MDILRKILKELEPYVYVVGSYARGTQTNESDIDLYVRMKSEEQMDKEIEELQSKGIYDMPDEYYMKECISIFNKYNVIWDSCIIGHISSENLPIMIEASWHYVVDEDNAEIFDIDILGIKMKATIDTYKKEV